MKVILVVDKLDWAFGKVAENMKANTKIRNIDILCTSNHKSIKEFLDTLKIKTKEKSIIHFFWRDYLYECLIYSKIFKKYQKIFTGNKITTHIPDHLFIDPEGDDYNKRIELMRFVDGYFVTSKKLYDLYSEQHDFKGPYGVILDNPKIKVSNTNEININKNLNVVWIGNSKWGEYLKFVDYKGLKEIILPALHKFKETGRNLIYDEFDSSKIKTSHDDILKKLMNADILLISSIAEGTPLPLLEAMANRCAIVTTDVGVAREILPEEQIQFIVERNSNSFTEALIKLDNDRELLEKLKKENQSEYLRRYVNSDNISNRWKEFFDSVLIDNNDEYKIRYFVNQKNSLKNKINSILIYRASQIAIKANIIERLKKSRTARSIYYKMISSSLGEFEYDSLEPYYKKNISGKKNIAIYSKYWSGVATSTISFFGESSLAFPYYKNEFPQINNHKYLDILSSLLANSNDLKSIIMSGGTTLQLQLSILIKNKNKNIKIFFGWHGSPAQWVDSAQYKTFDDWLGLYKKGFIDGIISFKPELADSLNRLDINSYSIGNYIVKSKTTNSLNEPSPDNYSIGLFAAMFSWYKNPFPQLLAIGTTPGAELVTNLTIEQDMSWLTNKVRTISLNNNLSNKEFIQLLSRLHVVSYITNTECSPMIALEAISVGTPCIVGPAGNIYKGYSELESFLVEHEVDNPTAIRNRLLLVRDNYSEIRLLIKEFAGNYNNKLDEIKKNLYKELTK